MCRRLVILFAAILMGRRALLTHSPETVASPPIETIYPPIRLQRGHQDAEQFLLSLSRRKIRGDVLIFDPPYSPRQISEVYQAVGREVGMKETQSAVLYQRVRLAALDVLTDTATVLSFGWNTVGMGKENGFEIVEIMMVCHGGAHNDTICMAERRVQPRLW